MTMATKWYEFEGVIRFHVDYVAFAYRTSSNEDNLCRFWKVGLCVCVNLFMPSMIHSFIHTCHSFMLFFLLNWLSLGC
ncbi:hypothetical protein HanLR1_Chr09g0306471 [Helianthus annuus]|nr:hypothetical protein HanHA89_Chr09g0327001 [Helianthus annuus]KAJ0706392.1 hypothetical protein HanLR1_Chr09g0306471 [Helianthus annuus]